MATRHEIKRLSEIAALFPNQLLNCVAVALALIAEGMDWWRERGIFSNPSWTDYMRTRDAILELCSEALSTLSGLREEQPSSQLIRAYANVAKIQSSCRLCPKHNIPRVARGERFECLYAKNVPKQETSYRFILNEKGEILEQS